MKSTAATLIGYNTSIRHGDQSFHVQTEDSGTDRPHVTTHLFADGGYIVVTRRTDYAAYVGTSRYPAIVKALLRAQHREMLDRVRTGRCGSDDAGQPPEEVEPFDLRSLEGAIDASSEAPNLQTDTAPSPTPLPPTTGGAVAREDEFLNLFPGSDTSRVAETLNDVIVRHVALYLETIE